MLKNKLFNNIFIIFCFTAFASFSHPLFSRNFNEGSLTYLYGEDFKVEPAKQQTITFEYVVAKDWFDMFVFIDNKDYSPDSKGRYGELTPKFSFYEFEKKALIKRLSIASTFERGKNNVERNLFGIGVDLNVSDFRYFNVNIYNRNNPNVAGTGYQITTVYAYPHVHR